MSVTGPFSVCALGVAVFDGTAENTEVEANPALWLPLKLGSSRGIAGAACCSGSTDCGGSTRAGLGGLGNGAISLGESAGAADTSMQNAEPSNTAVAANTAVLIDPSFMAISLVGFNSWEEVFEIDVFLAIPCAHAAADTCRWQLALRQRRYLTVVRLLGTSRFALKRWTR